MEDIKEQGAATTTGTTKPKGQTYNYSDQELIRQLAKSRMSQGQELEFEDLSGYELPPRTQFSMISKPAVSIKYGKMTFNMACVRMFDDALFVLTPVNRDKKRLMVVPCKEEESASLQWARIKADSTKTNRTISSEEFVLKLFKLMGWKLNCRYQVLGRIALAKPGPMPVLIFDLEEAIMYDSKPVEFVNEETGEIKKKQIKYYPEEYKECIGKSYNDYIEGKQMNLFEFLDEYTGQSYSDHKEEAAPAEAAEIKTYTNGESDSGTENSGAEGTTNVGDLANGDTAPSESGALSDNPIVRALTEGSVTDE